VRKTSILPAQYDSDVGGKVLLGAVDAVDVHNPDPDRVGAFPDPGRSIKAGVSALRMTWVDIARETTRRNRFCFITFDSTRSGSG